MSEMETTPFGATHHVWTDSETGSERVGRPIYNGDRFIADAARAYLEARRKNAAAEPCDWERARAEVDRCYHDLLVACGYEDQE